MNLGPLQQAQFDAMTPEQLCIVIADSRRQADMIGLAITIAAERRRAELQERILYCERLLRKDPK